MKYLLICFILISKPSNAQVEYSSTFYDEILREHFYNTKDVKEIGLAGRVKNIKLYIQSVKRISNKIIEREPQFGFFTSLIHREGHYQILPMLRLSR